MAGYLIKMYKVIILFFLCLIFTLAGIIGALYLRKLLLFLKRKYREKRQVTQVKKISGINARVVHEHKRFKRKGNYHAG